MFSCHSPNIPNRILNTRRGFVLNNEDSFNILLFVEPCFNVRCADHLTIFSAYVNWLPTVSLDDITEDFAEPAVDNGQDLVSRLDDICCNKLDSSISRSGEDYCLFPR